jgi:transposase
MRLDTAKSWFQVHGIDESGQVVLRRKLARGKVLQFFAGLTPCVIGLEACGGAHFWARELIKLGHDARLMPARYVRAHTSRPTNTMPPMPRHAARRFSGPECGLFRSRAKNSKAC